MWLAKACLALEPPLHFTKPSEVEGALSQFSIQFDTGEVEMREILDDRLKCSTVVVGVDRR